MKSIAQQPDNVDYGHSTFSPHQVGEGVEVWLPVNVYGCVIGNNCRLSPFVEVQRGAVLGDGVRLATGAFVAAGTQIGANTWVGQNAVICNCVRPNPGADWTLRQLEDIEDCHPATIGMNVVIGAGAVILPDVRIHNGATIGAGAVVTKDVRSGVTVVGNPAREIG